MGIYYSTGIASGTVFNKDNLHLLKNLIADDLELSETFDQLIEDGSSVSGVYFEIIDNIPVAVFNEIFDGNIVVDLSMDSMSESFETTIVMYASSTYVDLKMSDNAFSAFSVNPQEFLPNDSERAAFKRLADKLGEPEMEPGIIIWGSIS